MARSVKTVFPYAEFLVIVVGNAVEISLLGHSRVESRIENDYHRNVGKNGFAGFDSHNVGGIVEGSKLDVFAADAENVVGYENGGIIVFRAVNHSVADGGDFVHRGDDAAFLVHEGVENHSYRDGVIGHGIGENEFLSVSFMSKFASFDTYPFAKTFGYDGFVLHIDELIFKTGAACVDN